MSAEGRGAAWRAGGLAALGCIACGVVVGAAYTLVAPPLAPFAPFALSGWGFAAITLAATGILGCGLGAHRPRAVVAMPLLVAALAAAIYALLLALPAFAPYGGDTVGLINYALNQAAFAFFIIIVLTFPAAIVGLLANYFWNDR